MKYLVNVDLVQNELQNARIQNLGAAPATPVTGQLYYDTTTNILYWWNGTTWVAAKEDTSGLAAHLADTTDAHDASAISYAGGTGMSATDVEAALDELATEKANSADLTAHLNDTVDAHDASAISYAGGTGISATDVEAAIDELATEKADITYVDNVASGLDIKASVRAATTANITLTGAQTIDGVSVIAGDRVLVKDQTTAANNGIYVAAAGAWSRASDADTNAEVTGGMFTFVEEGTVNGDTGWVLTTNNPITLGTTSLAFTQFTGAAQVTAGAGLTKTGSTLDVVGTTNRITVAADSVDISTSYVGQASITTLGTITTGVWNGTNIAVANGGTGSSTAAGARTNLGAPGWFAANVGDGSSTSIAITHNLGSRDVKVEVYRATTPWDTVWVDVERNSTTQVTLKFAVAPTSNQYRVVIVGM